MLSDPAYTVLRTRRRLASITISPHNKITVRVPWNFSEEQIRKFLDSRQKWIAKVLERNRPWLEWQAARRYETGDAFFYLGREYRLEIRKEPGESVHIENESLCLSAERPSKDVIVSMLEEWYKSQAREIFAARLRHYENEMGLVARGLRIKHLRSLWGSCTSGEMITLNWRLVMAALEVIDYVIVHELGHLKHPNHSRRFWEYTGRYAPDYARHRRWLNQNGRWMTL